jgi:limonene-1,2-epoxide hydrolase
MSSAGGEAAVRSWSVDAFIAFWADPDPARLPAVRAILTDDIIGYWPRPIGIVRGASAYFNVIEAVVTGSPRFALAVAEHATSGEFTFIRWIATVADGAGVVQFDGCDRVRTRDGLVCENYVFCDHPYFEKVADRLSSVPGL